MHCAKVGEVCTHRNLWAGDTPRDWSPGTRDTWVPSHSSLPRTPMRCTLYSHHHTTLLPVQRSSSASESAAVSMIVHLVGIGAPTWRE